MKFVFLQLARRYIRRKIIKADRYAGFCLNVGRAFLQGSLFKTSVFYSNMVLHLNLDNLHTPINAKSQNPIKMKCLLYQNRVLLKLLYRKHETIQETKFSQKTISDFIPFRESNCHARNSIFFEIYFEKPQTEREPVIYDTSQYDLHLSTQIEISRQKENTN